MGTCPGFDNQVHIGVYFMPYGDTSGGDESHGQRVGPTYVLPLDHPLRRIETSFRAAECGQCPDDDGAHGRAGALDGYQSS